MKNHLFNLCCLSLIVQTANAKPSHPGLSNTPSVLEAKKEQKFVYPEDYKTFSQESALPFIFVEALEHSYHLDYYMMASSCAAITPSYLEDFESYLDVCWSESKGPVTGPDAAITSSQWIGGSYLNASSNGNSAKVNLFTDNRQEWLLSPVFDLTAGGYEINLDVAVTAYSGSSAIDMGSDDYVSIMQSLDGGSSWTAIYTWNTTNQPSHTGENLSIDVSGINSATTQFAIFATDGSVNDNEDYYFYIDDFKVRTIPTCLEGTFISVSDATNETADLVWDNPGTATTWELQYGTEGFTLGTGTSVLATDTNYTLLNLDGNIEYEVYVRGICGPADSSEWVGPATFTTLCDPFTPYYKEEFTTYLDECWSESKGSVNGPDDNIITASWTSSNFINTFSEGKSARIYLYSDTKTEWLITPDFDLSAGGYEINLDVGLTETFDASAENMGSDDSVCVMQSLNGGDTWTILHTWKNANQPSNTRENISIDISSVTSNAKFAIYASEGVIDDSESYYFYIDNFVVRTVPTCLANTNLEVSTVLSNTAQLKWNSPGSASSWQIEYGEDGFTQGTGTFVLVSDTNYTLNSLTESTDYQVYVRSVCGAADSSEWIGPVEFTTLCNPFTPDYHNEFTVFPGECWSESEGPLSGPDLSDNSSIWNGANYLNISGSNKGAKLNLFTTSADEWLISPLFDLSAGGYQINLDVAVTNYNSSSADNMGSDDSVRVMQSLDGGTTWTMLYSWSEANQPSNLGENVSIDISSLTSTHARFAIFATDGPIDDGEDYDFFVDNFKVRTVPSCLESNNLSVSNITANTVDLLWFSPGNATSWLIEYGESGFTQGTGNTVVSSDTTYLLQNLIYNTDYQVYVKSICSAGDSSDWIGPVSFTTICGIITPDYHENFTSFLNACWSESEGPLSGPNLSDETSEWNGGNYLNISGSNKAAKINLFTTSRDEWLLSPHYDLSAGGYEINLNVAVTNYNSSSADNMGSDDSVRVMQSIDGGSSWSTIYSWTLANQPSNTGENVSINVSTVTSADVQFAIYATDGPVDDTEDYDFFVDDFKVRTVPTCLEGYDLTTTDIESDNASILWFSPGSATSWQIEYGLNGFTQGSGTFLLASDTNYTIQNLVYNTDYQVYVRSICNPGDSSQWIGPLDFTTICGVITPDYEEDFTSYLNACWSESEGPLSGPNTSDVTSEWLGGNYLNVSGTNKAAKINLFTTSRDEWLLSPVFDLSAGGYELSLDVAVTNYNSSVADNMGSDDSVRVMQSTDGGSTWTMLYNWNVANQPSHTGERVAIDISGITGNNVQFAIFATDGPVDDSEDYDFFCR